MALDRGATAAGGSVTSPYGAPMENDVAGLYSRVASRYGSTGPAVFAHFGQRLVNLAALAPGEHVLDVGVGRGAILFPAAARVGTRGQVTGIDVARAGG
jgi:ubiquinone/menaquinone biosynthesis C-methylase UbiE